MGVYIDLQPGEAGNEVLVRGPEKEAADAAELVRAFVQTGLAKLRKEKNIPCDPERKPFWHPDVRPVVAGAVMPLPCPLEIADDEFDLVVQNALTLARNNTFRPLALVREA